MELLQRPFSIILYQKRGAKSMTNEQLATFIQEGGNDELTPLLWDKVRKFVYQQAGIYYETHTAICNRRGVELWDLKQAGYLAFLEAVKGFKADSGYKFLSFIHYPLQTAFQDVLGTRTQSGREEPLNNCTSLDKPIKEEDGETTLGELQADEQSTDFIEKLEGAMCSEIIRAEVDTLPDQQAEVIKLFYFEGLTLSEIGTRYGVSTERARQIRAKAERTLRANKILRKLYNEHYQGRYVPRWKYYDWQPENFQSRSRSRSSKPLEQVEQLFSSEDVTEIRQLLASLHLKSC